jgi:hypothetical protein
VIIIVSCCITANWWSYRSCLYSWSVIRSYRPLIFSSFKTLSLIHGICIKLNFPWHFVNHNCFYRNCDGTYKNRFVPQNDTAKLMYYLLSVSLVISLETFEDNIARLTDYKNHYLLTNDEKVKLLSLCKQFSPDELDGKCFFHSDENVKYSELLCFRLKNWYIYINS